MINAIRMEFVSCMVVFGNVMRIMTSHLYNLYKFCYDLYIYTDFAHRFIIFSHLQIDFVIL